MIVRPKKRQTSASWFVGDDSADGFNRDGFISLRSIYGATSTIVSIFLILIFHNFMLEFFSKFFHEIHQSSYKWRLEVVRSGT